MDRPLPIDVTPILAGLADLTVERAFRDDHPSDEPYEDLVGTVVLAAFDALLGLQLRHPDWTARLARMRLLAVDGELGDPAQLARDNPLGGASQS